MIQNGNYKRRVRIFRRGKILGKVGEYGINGNEIQKEE